MKLVESYSNKSVIATVCSCKPSDVIVPVIVSIGVVVEVTSYNSPTTVNTVPAGTLLNVTVSLAVSFVFLLPNLLLVEADNKSVANVG